MLQAPPDTTAALTSLLKAMRSAAVAVSGGVDSMTLAFIAHRVLGRDTTMLHAISPAVPREASERVQAYAGKYGWNLRLIDAAELDDPDYVRNPVDRCYFCKKNLYGTIAKVTDRQMVSGTNLDDLGDYRPGLAAARRQAVRHPYVEAGIDKAGVRRLAAAYGLNDLTELPAAPCLASRIETGLFVTPDRLRLIEAVERVLHAHYPSHTIRARMRAGGLTIELDQRLSRRSIEALHDEEIRAVAQAHGEARPISYAAYRRGSAFLGKPVAVHADRPV